MTRIWPDYPEYNLLEMQIYTDVLRAKTKAVNEQTEELRVQNEALNVQLDLLRTNKQQLKEKLDLLLDIKKFRAILRDSQ